MNSYAIIITHFISDWILQPRASAEKKTSNPLWMIAHTLIIFGCFIAANCFSNNINGYIFYLCGLNSMLHFLCDSFIWRLFGIYAKNKSSEYKEKNLYAKDYWFYFAIAIDQMLHICLALYLFR